MDAFDAAMFFIRAVVGLTLAAHGAVKLASFAGTAGWFDSIGMRPGKLHASAAGCGEIVAGMFLAGGFLTSFSAFGFAALMVVAGWTSHRDNGFFIIKEGWEYVMILAAIAVTIATLGPGRWSVDATIGIDDIFDGFVGTAISLGGGPIAGILFLITFYRPSRPHPTAN